MPLPAQSALCSSSHASLGNKRYALGKPAGAEAVSLQRKAAISGHARERGPAEWVTRSLGSIPSIPRRANNPKHLQLSTICSARACADLLGEGEPLSDAPFAVVVSRVLIIAVCRCDGAPTLRLCWKWMLRLQSWLWAMRELLYVLMLGLVVYGLMCIAALAKDC